MSIDFKAPVGSSYVNTKLMSRTTDTSTTGKVEFLNATQSSSLSTGAVVVSGGAAIGKKLRVGEDTIVTGGIEAASATISGAVNAGSVSATGNISADSANISNTLQANSLQATSSVSSPTITSSTQLSAEGRLTLLPVDNNSLTGADAYFVPAATDNIVYFTNASLTSIEQIDAAANGRVIFITNLTGATVVIKNLSGVDTFAQIVTGTGADLDLEPGASIILYYEGVSEKWYIVGGSGAGVESVGASGSIQFSDGAGGLDADASNLFWDNTNNRLGINTNTPSVPLDVNGQAWVNSGNNGTAFKAGTGAYLSSFLGDGFFHSGSTLDSGGAWTATETSSVIAYFSSNLEPGTFILFADTGLTPSAGFSPTPRFRFLPTGELRLSGSTNGYVGIKSTAVGPNNTYTLPGADGSSGQFLKTDGAGNLSWDSVGGGANTTLSNLSSPTAINQDLTFNKFYPHLRTPDAVADSEYMGFKTGDAGGALSGGFTWETGSAPSISGGFAFTSGPGGLSRGSFEVDAAALYAKNNTPVRFMETTANGSNWVGVVAPSSLSANYTYTLPSVDGSGGDVLTTDGSGSMSWTNAGFSNPVTSATPAGGASLAIDVAKKYQTFVVSGSGGAVTLSTSPFGSTPPTTDGSIIVVICTDDTNTVTIPQNDAADGVLHSGDITLARGETASFMYITSLDRYVRI